MHRARARHGRKVVAKDADDGVTPCIRFTRTGNDRESSREEEKEKKRKLASARSLESTTGALWPSSRVRTSWRASLCASVAYDDSGEIFTTRGVRRQPTHF